MNKCKIIVALSLLLPMIQLMAIEVYLLNTSNRDKAIFSFRGKRKFEVLPGMYKIVNVDRADLRHVKVSNRKGQYQLLDTRLGMPQVNDVVFYQIEFSDDPKTKEHGKSTLYVAQDKAQEQLEQFQKVAAMGGKKLNKMKVTF